MIRFTGLFSLAITLLFLYASGATAADLYVSSQGGGSFSGGVYKITPTGSVSEPITGLDFPQGVAVDANGNVFVAQGDILKFTPQGSRSTFYGFNQTPAFDAWALTFDRGGSLWVSNGDGLIDVFTPTAQRTTFATGLSNVQGIAIDGGGNAFLADGLHTIFKYLPDGTRSTFDTGLNGPVGLAFDPSGNLYASAALSGIIYRYTPAGVRTTLATGLPAPWGLACDADGNLYDAEYTAGLIYKFSPTGSRTTFASGLVHPEFMTFYPQTFPVPEPATISMMMIGAAFLLLPRPAARDFRRAISNCQRSPSVCQRQKAHELHGRM
jgi:sugar lactone lactonase YvrE